jgi:transposase
MTTTATPNTHGTTTERVLFLAFELREKTWKLGFTTGPGHKPRERGVAARNQGRVLHEVAQAKKRFGLPESAPVVRCYEAGRDGFWLHRFFQAHGITNHVVDSSASEVSRRQRRAKSDGLDVRKLLSMLIRYHGGERQVWHVVNAPSVEAEDQRHPHRDVETLKQERGDTTRRIKGLLSSQGVRVTTLSNLPAQLDDLRLWDGSPIPPGLRRRLLRVSTHHRFLSQQIAQQRRPGAWRPAAPHGRKARRLPAELRGYAATARGRKGLLEILSV